MKDQEKNKLKMYKIKVSVSKHIFMFELNGKWYTINRKYKIGQRLIAFYKMAEGDEQFIPPLVVPVQDAADLYKLLPSKRGREIIDRFVAKQKKENNMLDTT